MSSKKTHIPQADPNFGHVLTRTNEEIAAADASAREKNAGFPKVQFLADETDKRVSNFDPWSEVDPMTAALIAIPGGPKADRAYKLCSNNSAQLLGGHAGYVPERDEDGNTISIGNMFVGSIPKEVAERRRALNAARAKEQIDDQEEKYRGDVEEITRQASDLGMKLTPIGAGDYSQRSGDSLAESQLGIEVTRGEEI